MDGGSKFWHKRASSSSSLTQNKHHRMNFNQKSLSSTPIRWAYWRLLTMIYSSSAFDVEELWILSCLENSISVCGTSDLPVKYKHLYIPGSPSITNSTSYGWTYPWHYGKMYLALCILFVVFVLHLDLNWIKKNCDLGFIFIHSLWMVFNVLSLSAEC